MILNKYTMKFHLIGPSFQNAENSSINSDADFLLEEDRWNDFGYYTLYHVHAINKSNSKNKKRTEYLGHINIMRKGQKSGDSNLIRNYVGEDFSSLPDDFCSLSMSVELYRGLDRVLDKAEKRQIFTEALQMIFSVNDKRYGLFKNEPCFETSLMRNATMNAYALQLGREIMLDKATSYNLAQIPLVYTFPSGKPSIKFDFSNTNSNINDKIEIPARLLACIGNNGAGKSTILYRLARILFSSPAAREKYAKELGSITPQDAGFRRLFLISYSAFDNFELPGTGIEDYKLILEGLENRNGRLVYCGIRDIKKEYAEKITKLLNDNTDNTNIDDSIDYDRCEDGSEDEKKTDSDHSAYHKLKTINNLAEEFYDCYYQIYNNKDMAITWNKLIGECSRANNSFQELYTEYPLFCNKQEIIAKFRVFSTGIKYLLHSLSMILTRIEYNSIVIFDEPENHIQPPLLCKFLYCLRIISHKYSSLILVATHSPVILQETLSKNVIIVSRNGSNWNFRKPKIETYGENIGNITNEVFNLNTSVTNYQKTAEKIFTLLPPESFKTSDPLVYLKKIKEETGLDFGNEMQAYLISRVISASN